tara:strand:- start:25126 stop:25308 length:183 start_codon:yes stop_codon:yes gene_type:complete
MKPKVDPQVKADQALARQDAEKERKVATAESSAAARRTARDLQDDIRSVYGLPSIFSNMR